MIVDELEQTGDDVPDVVEHPLIRVQRQISEDDGVGVGHVGREPWARAAATVDRPVPPEPVTATVRAR